MARALRSLQSDVNEMPPSSNLQCDHSPRQVRALLVTVTAGAGVATRSELGATLDHRTGNTGPKALLKGTGGSGTHERHFGRSQWESMG